MNKGISVVYSTFGWAPCMYIPVHLLTVNYSTSTFEETARNTVFSPMSAPGAKNCQTETVYYLDYVGLHNLIQILWKHLNYK